MSCGGGHLGFPIGIQNKTFVEDFPGKMFQNASSLKPLGQLKPNFPGMIIGRSSTNFLFFMPCFGSHFENGRHLENFENTELLL
jgi:hypothetical protein